MNGTATKGLRNPEIAEQFAAKKLTWKSIKDAISPGSYDNPNYLGIFYFVRDLIVYGLVIAGLVMTDAWYFLLPLWLLSGFIVSGLFIVGHDACHGALFKNKTLAWWIGQIAFLPSFHAYHQWGYGHNRVHHGHTIKLRGDFVWEPESPENYARKSLLGKFMHRIYWSAGGAGIYYLLEIWAKGMIIYRAPSREANRDKALMIGFILLTSTILTLAGGLHADAWSALQAGNLSVASLQLDQFSVAAGLWLCFKVFIMPFLMFNYFIGITVYVHHIHEDIPWKSHGDWSPAYGQLFGTINYHINPIANFFLHNIFIHMPHHVQVRIPFYHLPKALEDIKSQYGEFVVERGSVVMRDYIQSTRRCKLFDEASGRWMTYKEARHHLENGAIEFENAVSVA